MLPLSAAELATMRATKDDAMMDTCVILRYGSTKNAYNLPDVTYTPDASGTACGFEANPSKEVLDQVPMSEARVRLPIGTTLDHKDRIRITHRFSETESSPITFDVVGLTKRGPSGSLVWLKKVTDV